MAQRYWIIGLVTIILLAGVSTQAADTTDLVRLLPGQSDTQAAVTLVDNSSAGMTLQFRAPSLEISQREHGGEKYQVISIPGEEIDGATGQPALPLITRLVALPDGMTLQVRNIDTHKTPVSGQYHPWPAQGFKDKFDHSFDLDSPYYQGLKRAPEVSLVTVGKPGLMRGVRMVPVHFRPVLWTPSDGKINVAAEINVTFDLVPSSDNNKSTDDGRLMPQSFANIFEHEVLGYQSMGSVMEGPGTYLLIYPDDLAIRLALDPLITWRQRQGYNVVIASTAVTGTTTTSIKNYIQGQYNSLSIPLEFVTLIGDANGAVAIPTYNEALSGYSGEGDHEYTLLEGGDVLSDVHLGRISVTSVAMLTDVLDKIIGYENAPYMDDDLGWFTRAGLAGDPSESGYSCIWVNQWVKHQLLDLNYTQVDTIWGGNFATLMSQTINQGESIFTYRGYYGMSGFHTGYIDALNNGKKLPFALIQTCDTGSFESDVECRSEAFLRNTNGGAVAAIGTATIGTHTRYNNCVFQGVAQGVLNSGDTRLGPGLTTGKLHLYQNYIDQEPEEVEIWSTWNNLMGDPATAIWTAVPTALTVDYPATITSGTNSLPVTVTSGGTPQSGALVTLFREGRPTVNALTDAYGQVDMPLSSLSDGEYLVTVTGHNLKPYLGGVNVGTLTASVNFEAMTVIDGGTANSVGNSDSLINPGETIELGIDLTNHGTGGVNDVTADLSSHTDQVTVTQASSTFGYMGAGATVSGQQNFVVSLGVDVPSGTTIPLELVATDGTESWTSLVNLLVTGPMAEVQSFTLGSGTLNPGQTTSLEVTLNNTGNLATAGATATLSSVSNWISITDNTGSFGAISVGGSANNAGDTFTINAKNDCYPGHVATLNLDLVFAEGGTASLPILVTIGSAISTDPTGPDNRGYYAFDNTDTGYAYAPVYDWVEISPTSGGSGTSVGLQDFDRYEDDVVIVDLPFAFTYYGSSFTKLSICSNGWISMGGTNLRHFRNWTLPSAGTPDNMIAVYWDDLMIQSSNSDVYSWYDSANHRMIIEWHNMANAVTGVAETFQVFLYDPAYSAGDTGDGIITMNYQSVTATDAQTGYATVGIQNEDRDDAVLYTYYNMYPASAPTLGAGRSITFRTLIPQASGTLSGTVTNVDGGGAVDGATIHVLGSGMNVMSSVLGAYQASLTTGTYDIAVSHPSFAPDTTFGVVIQEDLETVVDFALTDIAGPLFTMQTLPESTADTAGPYDVVFSVTDYSGVQETHFFYTSSTNGGPFELALTPEGPTDTWRASIPGQPDSTLVQYWLTSSDLQGLSTTEPAGAPFNTHSFMIAHTSVLYASDMENASDWSVGSLDDGATSGIWTNVDPNGVFDGATEVSPEDDHSDPGTMCWITGQDPIGANQGNNDVDGGLTTLMSPVLNVSGARGLEVQYYRWYTNNTGNSPDQDNWVVQAQAQDGSWVDLENTTASNRSWQQENFILADKLTVGDNIRFRFLASDYGLGSVVEAGVDDFILTSFPQLSDGEAPQVSLISPNGGEVLTMDSTVDITWNQSDDIGVVQVEVLLSTDSGLNFDQTIGSGALNGVLSWTVPALADTTNRVKVVCHDAAGNTTEAISAADFTIFNPASPVDNIPANKLAMAQNIPNPFNPRTEIRFSLPSPQDVTLRIYNVEGHLVRTLMQGHQGAGSHTVMWGGKNNQGSNVASGLYFYRLVTDSGVLTRKMTLVK